MLAIREEQEKDAAGIHAVHVSAFPSGAEARLVDAIRQHGNASVSLVAVMDGRIVGRILFSPVSIGRDTASARGVGLAPVAVLPEHQRKGVGAALIRAGIEECRRAGVDFVVVLGDPSYYRRFGFVPASSASIGNEYGVDEEFMVLELGPDSLRGLRGLVRYGAEFAALEAPKPGDADEPRAVGRWTAHEVSSMTRADGHRHRQRGARMARRSFPLSRVYGLLEPGPVVLVTTVRRGRPNIMTLSWYTPMEFEPPLVGCVISNRNYSFATLKATRECVINIPTVKLADKVVGCGNTSGADTDKLETFGLTPVPGRRVKAPLIGECYANLECKVVDTRMVSSYCFFVLEVLAAWIDSSVKDPRTIHHCGRGAFMVAGKRIKLPSKMK